MGFSRCRRPAVTSPPLPSARRPLPHPPVPPGGAGPRGTHGSVGPGLPSGRQHKVALSVRAAAGAAAAAAPAAAPAGLGAGGSPGAAGAGAGRWPWRGPALGDTRGASLCASRALPPGTGEATAQLAATAGLGLRPAQTRVTCEPQGTWVPVTAAGSRGSCTDRAAQGAGADHGRRLGDVLLPRTSLALGWGGGCDPPAAAGASPVGGTGPRPWRCCPVQAPSQAGWQPLRPLAFLWPQTAPEQGRGAELPCGCRAAWLCAPLGLEGPEHAVPTSAGGLNGSPGENPPTLAQLWP